MNTGQRKVGNSAGDNNGSPGPMLETQAFACTNVGCNEDGLPSAMFNLACNPATIDLDGLKRRVRCRRCALQVAKTNDRALGELGCGVYPLAQTLKTMAAAGARPKPEAEQHETSYACAERYCAAEGTALEMFNFYDLANVDPDEVLTAIRCKRHAERYAAERGKTLGEPGSGTFPIVRNPVTRTGTLRREALTLYSCAHPGCDEEGAGPEMYKCFNAGGAKIADVLALIRCERHALEVAATRNKTLGEPGCGITPLAATIRRIQASRHATSRERWETEYLQWYLATRTRNARATAFRRRS